jgi:hypothetical protein
MQRELKLRVHAQSTWGALAGEDWLGRFVRTLEAGRRRAPRWQVRLLDGSDGRVGWRAEAHAADRTMRISLTADGDGDPGAAEWRLRLESGPLERAPRLRGAEWWVGALLAVAGYLAAREHVGVLGALAAAVALWLTCGILPHLFERPLPELGDEPDPADQDLLDRVQRGAASFAGFELLTTEWSEPELP